jgi:membrane-anchored protein YejM (alkaline phosphatase superfamily)
MSTNDSTRVLGGALGAHLVSPRRRAVSWMWLGNVLLGTLIGLSYLRDAPLHSSLRLWLFAHLGLVSAVATSSLLPGAIPWLLAKTKIGERSFAGVQAAVWMLFHVGLMIDTRVWGLFRYHFNSAAWNLITSRGSQDSYNLGPKIWFAGFGLGAAVFALELLGWRLLIAQQFEQVSRQRFFRPALLCTSGLALIVCIEKSIYARADLELDREVVEVSQAFPLYPRLTVKTLLPEPLKAQLDSEPNIRISAPGAQLAYPRVMPSISPRGPRPNILILVVDSWRRDMLRADVTPNLARFAQGVRRFDDHLSGGNGTRFGVFSLLYGLHGSYWWPVLEARRSPVLVDVLLALGYDVQVFSAASMNYPEFRSTAWVRVPERVHDDFGESAPGLRDVAPVEACLEWWRTRDASQPFFGFVLLDSAHQKYDFPPDQTPFEPYARDIDYLEMAGSHEPELVEQVRNRYMNALYRADQLAERLIDSLRQSGALDDTLVIVTGDHGEEFAEHGYWGHTGNFTSEQVAVPFLMGGPGVPSGVEHRPTSHVDVPATLLELLGADPRERADWCTGESLLAPLPQRARAVAGWEELGLWTASGILRVPRQRDDGVSACDHDWQLLPDQRAALEAELQPLLVLERDCARFLRPGGLADVR